MSPLFLAGPKMWNFKIISRKALRTVLPLQPDKISQIADLFKIAYALDLQHRSSMKRRAYSVKSKVLSKYYWLELDLW